MTLTCTSMLRGDAGSLRRRLDCLRREHACKTQQGKSRWIVGEQGTAGIVLGVSGCGRGSGRRAEMFVVVWSSTSSARCMSCCASVSSTAVRARRCGLLRDDVNLPLQCQAVTAVNACVLCVDCFRHHVMLSVCSRATFEDVAH